MASKDSNKTYYFISDLHLGGDGDLMKCDYTDEMIQFLKKLETEDKDSELIIVGDAFGFWELTSVKGTEKLDAIVAHHKSMFEQFKKTGENIEITLMVGNHDYDLACFSEYVGKLLEYNIKLDTSISVKREVAEKQIWIEHGQQIDEFNSSPDYGNPYAHPIGYYITKKTVAGASRYSVFGKTDWLKDIRSVDVRQLPDWLISNYFYNEMNPLLRWVFLPFLVLLTITILALLAQFLKFIGVFDANYLLNNPITRSLGIVGNAIQIIIFVSMVFWFFIFAVSIPLFFLYRDIRKTLQRMEILPKNNDVPLYVPDAGYNEQAEKIFKENPNVVAYIYGHTHDAFMKSDNNRAIINTGTWLKILKRIPVSFGLLPAVYYPTFRLNYFKIYEENNQVAVEYFEIPKTPGQELNWFQRLLIFKKTPEPGKYIPPKTLL